MDRDVNLCFLLRLSHFFDVTLPVRGNLLCVFLRLAGYFNLLFVDGPSVITNATRVNGPERTIGGEGAGAGVGVFPAIVFGLIFGDGKDIFQFRVFGVANASSDFSKGDQGWFSFYCRMVRFADFRLGDNLRDDQVVYRDVVLGNASEFLNRRVLCKEGGHVSVGYRVQQVIRHILRNRRHHVVGILLVHRVMVIADCLQFSLNGIYLPFRARFFLTAHFMWGALTIFRLFEARFRRSLVVSGHGGHVRGTSYRVVFLLLRVVSPRVTVRVYRPPLIGRLPASRGQREDMCPVAIVGNKDICVNVHFQICETSRSMLDICLYACQERGENCNKLVFDLMYVVNVGLLLCLQAILRYVTRTVIRAPCFVLHRCQNYRDGEGCYYGCGSFRYCVVFCLVGYGRHTGAIGALCRGVLAGSMLLPDIGGLSGAMGRLSGSHRPDEILFYSSGFSGNVGVIKRVPWLVVDNERGRSCRWGGGVSFGLSIARRGGLSLRRACGGGE